MHAKNYKVIRWMKKGKKNNALIKNTGLLQVLPNIYKEWPPHVLARNLRH
jgi:hypothetical protein